MTREELLEQAALDAFGLLEDYEAALYTRSFHHAPATVQDDVLRIQADLVSDERLLPTENPDPGLRQRVLDAVAQHIERETSQLAPLAIIGRPRAEQEKPEIAGKIYGPTTGVFWRVATFALCGAIIVVAYLLTEAKSFNQEVTIRALDNNTDGQLEKLIGPTVKDFIFDSTSTRVVLEAINPTDKYRGAIFIQEGAGKGFLVVEGLPITTTNDYSLICKDTKGTETVHKFAGTSKLHGANLEFSAALVANLKNATWRITDATGTVLLASI